MCRNIKKLRQVDRAPTDEELHDAALQFIRKISGFREPSRANRAVFDRAVKDVARASRRLFDDLVVREPVPSRGMPA
ncbi:DUF2277 domain-containing protein [bacterium]|nr:DUF2277 domain-containing protein [bacterium]